MGSGSPRCLLKGGQSWLGYGCWGVGSEAAQVKELTRGRVLGIERLATQYPILLHYDKIFVKHISVDGISISVRNADKENFFWMIGSGGQRSVPIKV